MIKSHEDFDLRIKKVKGELVFDSENVNLDREPLVLPLDYDGVLGTIKFTRRQVVYQSPFGKHQKLSVGKFSALADLT